MKVLFLGGTGNISTACVALALARGHHVGILTRGQRPAPPGVEALLGDRDDPGSNVSQLLRDNEYFRMHEELGTDPGVYYIVAGGP